ncbi:hypothetical protein LINPERPRIM_LOCUS34454 [Linum perenne]
MKKGVAVYDDPRIRFKRESLIQDYDDLLKETEATRKRMEVMKQRKMTLMAEVRFLRRKFNHLTENQNPKPDQNLLRSKMKKARNKGGVRVMNSSISHDSLKFDLNQKQKKSPKGRREAALRDSETIPDLNVRNNAPIFDLNQISMEEEELQTNGEMTIPRMGDLKIVNSLRGGIDEQHHQHNDVKLSGCRNLGNGSSRGGKRKISWQDPVAF